MFLIRFLRVLPTSYAPFLPEQSLILRMGREKRMISVQITPFISHGFLKVLPSQDTVPSVLAVHVLLEPGFKLSQLVLGSINHLWSSKQVSTAHAIINQCPDWVALHLSILREERQTLKVNKTNCFLMCGHPTIKFLSLHQITEVFTIPLTVFPLLQFYKQRN